MVVNKQCAICGTPRSIKVPTEGYLKWCRGEARIQDAMPGLSADDREMLMSGLCPTCWDKLFSKQ